MGKFSCYRCHKEIESPDANNADYVTSPDAVIIEPVESLIAVKHTDTTLDKFNEKEEIKDEEYNRVEVANFEEAKQDVRTIRVEIVKKNSAIQKTAIICPDCFNPVTDTVIWGVHKAMK